MSHTTSPSRSVFLGLLSKASSDPPPPPQPENFSWGLTLGTSACQACGLCHTKVLCDEGKALWYTQFHPGLLFEDACFLPVTPLSLLLWPFYLVIITSWLKRLLVKVINVSVAKSDSFDALKGGGSRNRASSRGILVRCFILILLKFCYTSLPMEDKMCVSFLLYSPPFPLVRVFCICPVRLCKLCE